jgi:hypothetical protein
MIDSPVSKPASCHSAVEVSGVNRIRGHRELPILIRALRQQNTALDAEQEAA